MNNARSLVEGSQGLTLFQGVMSRKFLYSYFFNLFVQFIFIAYFIYLFIYIFIYSLFLYFIYIVQFILFIQFIYIHIVIGNVAYGLVGINYGCDGRFVQWTIWPKGKSDLGRFGRKASRTQDDLNNGRMGQSTKSSKNSNNI